jgi:hypothetical protein
MSHVSSLPRSFALFTITALVLTSSAAFSIDWQVRLSPRNTDYLELVIFADRPIHDVLCIVNLYDEDDDVIATRRFQVTDVNNRVISGTIRKFLWHGMEGVKTAQGDFMDYKYRSGAYYGPAPGRSMPQMPPPQREFSGRIAPMEYWEPVD